MKKRHCKGILEINNKEQHRVDLSIKVHKNVGWFRARATLIVPLNVNIPSGHGRHPIGIFFCRKDKHKEDDDVFAVNSVDNSEIIKESTRNTEIKKIKVELIRTNAELTSSSQRPTVSKLDSDASEK